MCEPIAKPALARHRVYTRARSPTSRVPLLLELPYCPEWALPPIFSAASRALCCCSNNTFPCTAALSRPLAGLPTFSVALCSGSYRASRPLLSIFRAHGRACRQDADRRHHDRPRSRARTHVMRSTDIVRLKVSATFDCIYSFVTPCVSARLQTSCAFQASRHICNKYRKPSADSISSHRR